MRLTVAGSGTAAPEVGRVCSGYWVGHGDATILLDCGPGVVHRLAGLELPWARIDHLVLSHFHTDHIGDVPMLFFALKWGTAERRTAPLTVWAPHGIQDRLRAMRAAFGDHMEDPGFPVVIREVGPGESFRAGSVAVETAATPHTDASLAFLLEADGARLGYTGDTGPSPDLGRFFRDCDVLVAECSLPDGQAIDTHLSPRSTADLASIARPGRLVVTHVYPQLDRLDACARIRAAGWTGAMERARDGLALEVAAAGP